MKEKFKDIEGYEGLYQISNFGRVKSLIKKKILKPNKTDRGYYQVKLYKNKKENNHRINRLVAIHFILNLNNFFEVNHEDGDKLNNYYKNLKWCTRSENIQHAFDNKLKPVMSGEINGNSKLTKIEVMEIRAKYIPQKYTQKMLANEYNVSCFAIQSIINNKTWKHI